MMWETLQEPRSQIIILTGSSFQSPVPFSLCCVLLLSVCVAASVVNVSPACEHLGEPEERETSKWTEESLDGTGHLFIVSSFHCLSVQLIFSDIVFQSQKPFRNLVFFFVISSFSSSVSSSVIYDETCWNCDSVKMWTRHRSTHLLSYVVCELSCSVACWGVKSRINQFTYRLVILKQQSL